MFKLFQKAFIHVLFVGILILSGNASLVGLEPVSTPEQIERMLPIGWPRNGLLVLPEVGRAPYIQALRSAEEKIEMAAYKLSDPEIVDTILSVRRTKPHVKIDILIEPETFSHDQSGNVKSPIDFLKENGINVYTLSDRFNQAHYKMLIIDGIWGLVGTGNLDKESFDGLKEVTAEPCRDFVITLTNSRMVKDMERVFQADIHNERIVPSNDQLVWGPDTQRGVFLRMINSAKRSIRIYQQDFQDAGIARAVSGAARAGINVEVIMMPYPFSKKKDNNIPNQDMIRAAGGHVHLHGTHYIHAKMLLVDAEDPENRLLCLTSCNFYPDSLDQTRELGVLTKDANQISQVLEVFERDKKA